MSTFRSQVKNVLPESIQRWITQWQVKRIQQQYAGLSISETFDQIYSGFAWGKNDDGAPCSGTGSTGQYVEDYCTLVTDLLSAHSAQSLADLGCGNFNTGRLLVKHVARYVGVDAAKSVVDFNTHHYGGESTRFLHADLTKDSLPPADVAIVRQVLQHLTNAEISAALQNILSTYPLTFVTEHLYTGAGSRPNLNIVHGPGTRVPMRSGVFIDQPPFSVAASIAADIQYGPGEVLRTWIVAPVKTSGGNA